MKSIILLLCIILIGCETPEGHIGASASISEAKTRGVFVVEYTASPNPFIINDSLQLTVKEAWIENSWAYGSGNQTIIIAGYQLCITTTEADENKIEAADANFGVDADHWLRKSSKESFLGDFETPPGDSISYLVQRGDNIMGDSTQKKVIIGNLTLIKKQ